MADGPMPGQTEFSASEVNGMRLDRTSPSIKGGYNDQPTPQQVDRDHQDTKRFYGKNPLRSWGVGDVPDEKAGPPSFQKYSDGRDA